MARRVTKKDVGGCASRLADDLGKKFGGCWRRKNGKLEAVVGCWTVDYNPTYGGAVIQEIVSKGGGVTQPFGPMRRKPGVFCETTRFAQDALRVDRGRARGR